jgi:hypothetical protein
VSGDEAVTLNTFIIQIPRLSTCRTAASDRCSLCCGLNFSLQKGHKTKRALSLSAFSLSASAAAVLSTLIFKQLFTPNFFPPLRAVERQILLTRVRSGKNKSRKPICRLLGEKLLLCACGAAEKVCVLIVKLDFHKGSSLLHQFKVFFAVFKIASYSHKGKK